MVPLHVQLASSMLRGVIKRLHFPLGTMLVCVRWYTAYPLSLRNLEEMMAERGVRVDHATVHCWALKMLPVLAAVLPRRQLPVGTSWRVDETYVLVGGQWKYLYRAVDNLGQTVDYQLQGLLSKVDLGKTPRAGSKTRAQFDARQILTNWAGVDLTRINGLRLTAVLKILSELGPDLSRFANVKHFCSWLGLCPGTKTSGGKVLLATIKRSANRVRQALKMAAMSLSRSNSALGAFYHRLSGRMDKPRANTATAHKFARIVNFMLMRGEAFVDQSQQRCEERQRERSIAALKRRAAALGFQINPTFATA